MQQDAQKSEVHHATEDASTSPANRSPDAENPQVRSDGPGNPEGSAQAPADRQQRDEQLPGARVRRDESDLGGPIDLDVYDK